MLFNTLLACCSLLALAGQAMAAFNVTLGTTMFFPNNFTTLTYTPTIQPCQQQNCTAAQAAIDACNNDPTCLCTPDTIKPLVSCEQCMFTALVNANEPLPDPRAGSTPLLAGYVASCKAANKTVDATQAVLTLPTVWDGPTGIFVPTGGLVVTVGVGAFMGVSAIYLLSTM